MTEVVRYEVGSGTILVEVDDNSYGVDHPGRNEQGILDAGRRLEDALAAVRPLPPLPWTPCGKSGLNTSKWSSA